MTHAYLQGTEAMDRDTLLNICIYLGVLALLIIGTPVAVWIWWKKRGRLWWEERDIAKLALTGLVFLAIIVAIALVWFQFRTLLFEWVQDYPWGFPVPPGTHW